MAGWGAGQKIDKTKTSFIERQYAGRGIWERTVTDATELWNGMDLTNADAKLAVLVGTTGYTNCVRTDVGGGQYTVTGTQRTYAAWIQTAP